MNPVVVIADTFIQKLVDAGLVPESTTRVIIDARAGYAVELHFQTVELDSERIDVLVAGVKEMEVVNMIGDK